MGCRTGSHDSVGAFQVHREEGVGMNSIEQQILLQYLDALRREQKKATEVMTGIGVLMLILGMLLIFWKD